MNNIINQIMQNVIETMRKITTKTLESEMTWQKKCQVIDCYGDNRIGKKHILNITNQWYTGYMEGDKMATKSILKDINIRDKQLAKRFVNALENAENMKSKEVLMSKNVNNITKSQIKMIFAE